MKMMMKLVGPILHLIATALLISAAQSPEPSPPTSTTEYTYHTVGEAAGWYFNASTETTSANYTAWALTQTFNLGDYLIFNSDMSQSVLQTYNKTTYKGCSAADSDTSANDTIYSGGDSSADQPLTMAIPLTIEGRNYYFSGADDGTPCRKGMAFEIQVNHGLGLPPSLNQPPPPPYTEAPASSPPGNVTVPSGTAGNKGRDHLEMAGCALLLLLVSVPLIELLFK